MHDEVFDEVRRGDPEAESAVVGSILRQPDSIAKIASSLAPDDFLGLTPREIYRVCLELFTAGDPIDVYLVGEKLARDGKLVSEDGNDVGGAPGILRLLLDETPSAAHIVHYADIVRRYSAWRRLESFHRAGLGAVLGRTGEPEVLVAEAERKLSTVIRAGDRDQGAKISDLYVDLATQIEQSQNPSGQPIKRVKTGLEKLDKMIDLEPGETTVVGARTSVGKTAFALSVSNNAAFNGDRVLFVSLEMNALSIAKRSASSLASANLHALRLGKLSPEDVSNLVNVFDGKEGERVVVLDMPGATLRRIAAGARRLHLRQPFDLIVVDYLGLIEPEDRRINRFEHVGQTSRGLKQLARSLNVPVLVLAQLNRDLEKRADPRPRLSDLRESGSIEQDADVILLLHRPFLSDKSADPTLVEVDVAKNRNGPLGRIKVTFRPEFTRFENRAPEFPAA